MKWILSLAIVILVMLLLPFAIVAAKKSAKGKGRLGGAALAIGLAFGAIFDPAKTAAVENIQKRKDIGGAEDAQGDLLE
jgi:hypothetical protein